jgi:nucleotide-binding universal stress UspA family protein
MAAVSTGSSRRPTTTVAGGFPRVLVATDFGLEGDRAVRRAARLPLSARATVVVLHVLSPKIPASAASVVAGAAELELEKARHKLAALVEKRGRRDVEVSTRLGRGRAASEIARLAQATGASLVVVGRGGSGLSGTLLGSTAQRVAREARLPVLLVRLAATEPYHRVVLGFDGSADSLRAAKLAHRLAGAPQATVWPLYAFEDPRADLAPSMFTAAAKAKWRAFAPELAQEARRFRKLLAMVDSTRRWPLSCRPGDPRSDLLEAARKKRAELIVVGSRSKRGLVRMVLGSVAEAVLNRATCDVLISPRRHWAM